MFIFALLFLLILNLKYFFKKSKFIKTIFFADKQKLHTKKYKFGN